jgi:anti-sigma factor RsiW
MSSDSNFPTPPCARAEALRDYAFDDQLPEEDRRAMEQHLAGCADCALDLDRLRLTTAALRTLPEREIPQRIAFVSDRVFEPSPFRRFWNAGFASACVLAVALVVSAWHVASVYRLDEVRRAGETRPVVQTASVSQEQIDTAVAKAVAQVRAESARMIQTAVQNSERKHDSEYRNQMAAIGENFMVLQKRLSLSYAGLASNDTGVGQ